jgi:hypothetical protein
MLPNLIKTVNQRSNKYNEIQETCVWEKQRPLHQGTS